MVPAARSAVIVVLGEPEHVVQDLGAVLPARRAPGGRAAPGVSLMKIGKPSDVCFAGARVVELDEVAVAVDLRVGDREVVALDDVGRELVLLEHRPASAPPGFRRNGGLEHLHHLEAIGAAALVVGVEARVVDRELDERGERSATSGRCRAW